MGTEDEIRNFLVQGVSPSDLITHHHFKKSTVYKVLNKLKMKEAPIGTASWIVEDIRTDKDRYQPGDHVNVLYHLRNKSSLDLYVYRAGIELEWMREEDTWYVHGNRFLLHPQEGKQLRGEFNVPLDLPLGEYDLRFGIEGQFLSPSSAGQTTISQITWAVPITIEVKLPPTGIKIFISHSTKNMSLVKSLSNYLDTQGMTPIIAEDISSPGVYLPEKFQEKIRESDIFLALLTYEATRSRWVLHETNYAISINKPRILLKEESVRNKTIDQYEWTPFSINDPVEDITSRILKAIEVVRSQLVKPIALPFGGVILVGILAFIAGLAIGSRK